MVELQREFKRGEVYYVRYDDDIVGSTEGVGRPAVIISNAVGNMTSSTVNCVYLSSSPERAKLKINVELKSTTRRPSYALCNQIVTVDKTRFGTRMCTLTASEMQAIDETIAVVLGLSLGDPEAEDNARKLKEENTSQKIEIEMWKKLYEKALDQLVQVKLTADVAHRMEKTVSESEPEQELLVDINHCDAAELTALGFDTKVAWNIIGQRPYKRVEDLKSVPGVTVMGWGLVKNRICCVVDAPKIKETAPVKKDKVNVNTASWQSISDVTGLSETTAKSIVSYRNKNGAYRSIDDLTNVPRFGSTCLKKYGPMMEV